MNIETEISDTLLTKVSEFAFWVMRSGFYADIGLWFDSVDWLNELEATGAPFPVAMPNIQFPPENHPEYQERVHLDAKHFRNRNGGAYWGNEKTLVGILQVSVIDPNQIGDIPPTEVASKIIKHFRKNTILWTPSMNRIVIYDEPSLGSMLQDGHRAIYPVSIPYLCFVAS